MTNDRTTMMLPGFVQAHHLIPVITCVDTAPARSAGRQGLPHRRAGSPEGLRYTSTQVNVGLDVGTSTTGTTRRVPTLIPMRATSSVGMVSDKTTTDTERDMDEALVIVRTFSDRMAAEIARGALESAGIDSAIQADDAGGLRPELTPRSGVRLLVRESDAAEAEGILAGGPMDGDGGLGPDG
jgi:hypothetical protein